MKKLELFAMTAPGIEGILATELSSMGVKPGEIVAGGVAFQGDIDVIRRVNLHSRVANRVLVRLDEFHASTFHELERRAKKMEWARYLSPGEPVRFRVTCRKSRLYHSDAVADRLVRASRGENAEGAEGAEDSDADESQLFVVRILNDICTISADTSGALLHRRGYRQAIAKAPLRETLAAAMLIGAGWHRKSPLVDPMCGSGTIAIEGAMMARGIAPGLGRKFAFEKWPDHDEAKWKSLVGEARQSALPKAPGPIVASDRDAGAVAAALANAERAGVSNDIEVSERTISAAEFPLGPGWIVSNPPYGLRVGESGPLRNLYSQIGKILRDRAKGYLLALLSADRALDAQLGLELREVFRTTNGGIPVRLVIGGKA
ncbi:MAG: class I SAM-dependent RNA methyltransferase [Gemmatimonadales bacterium]